MNIVDDIVSRLIAIWAAEGLRVRGGVSDEQLSAFEARFGVRLPSDMRQYLRRVDGMETGDLCMWMQARLWPLNEFESARNECPPMSERHYEGILLFGDYLLWSHGYGIQVKSPDENRVFIVGGDTPIEVARDFT